MKICLQLAVIAGPFFLGYVLLTRGGLLAPKPQQRVEKRVAVREQPPVKQESRSKTPRRETPTPTPTPAQPFVREPEPPPPKKAINPFSELPDFVDLPDVSLSTPSAMFSVPEHASIELVTNDPALTLVDSSILWQTDDDAAPEAIAQLEVGNESLKLSWSESPPEDAVTALTNSLLEITASESSRAVALRAPISVEPLRFDLTDTVQRIACNLEPPPPIEFVRFELLSFGRLPIDRTKGAETYVLAPREEALLWYSTQDPIATKFVMLKRGKTAAIDVTHGFALPSGDEEILSVARGKKLRREIERLANAAENAANSIVQLKSYLSQLTSQLAQIRRTETTSILNGVKVPDSVKVAQKAMAITRTENEIAATRRNVVVAEGLIADRSRIEEELTALNRIAEFANTIDSTAVSYRFFLQVGDHEVD
ncbi:hypothetical protein [Bythopirellula polymerisocia]|nr:hypothetical protein [Bythopirellula polymerisocia]